MIASDGQGVWKADAYINPINSHPLLFVKNNISSGLWVIELPIYPQVL